MRRRRRYAVAGVWTAIGLATLSPAAANASPLRVSIARLQSEQSCSTYQMSEGRADVRVSSYAASASASWRTWLVHDCVDNFSRIRAALQAALAAGIDSPGPGGAYSLSGTIATLGTSSSGAGGADYGTRSDRSAVTFSYVVRNAAGNVVFGGTVHQSVETAGSVQTGDMTSGSAMDGQGLYARLQDALAASVARAVIFRLAPLRVVDSQDGDIRLNYGAPLLGVGVMIQAPGTNGRALRYVVSSASRGQAIAEPDGERGSVAIGGEATVIEPDDAGANARRYHKVELP